MPLTLAGREVLSLELIMPNSGAWVATGEVDVDEELSGAVEFEQDGKSVFTGTVKASTVYSTRTGFVVVGGAGGLDSVVRAQSYRNATLSLPVADILQQGGETLGEELSSSLAGHALGAWATGTWTVGRALSDLADHVGALWWVDADGGVRFAAVTPTDPILEGDIVDRDTVGRCITIAPESGHEWEFRPRTIIDGKTIVTVRYLLDGRRLRVKCEYRASALDAMFRALTRHYARRIDYLALYPAEVYSQDSDGTLQVFPDSDAIPKMSGVPLKLPAPGTDVRVTKGARVLVGFEGGDPDKPFAFGWGSEGFSSVSFGGGELPVSRVGDQVTVFLSTGVPIPLTGTVGGAPFVGTMTLATPVVGVIGSGNAQVLS